MRKEKQVIHIHILTLYNHTLITSIYVHSGNYTRYCHNDGTWSNIIINTCKSTALNDNEIEVSGTL